MIKHMDELYVMLLMKQQFIISHWYTVLQKTEKLWPMLNWPPVKDVMFLQKYKGKQFVCGYNIVTEGVIVIQLSSNWESQFDEVCGLQEIAIAWAIIYIMLKMCVNPSAWSDEHRSS